MGTRRKQSNLVWHPWFLVVCTAIFHSRNTGITVYRTHDCLQLFPHRCYKLLYVSLLTQVLTYPATAQLAQKLYPRTDCILCD